MPLYLDTHNKIPGLTGEAVAQAHAADLAVQGKHGVKLPALLVRRGDRARSSAWPRPPAPRPRSPSIARPTACSPTRSSRSKRERSQGLVRGHQAPLAAGSLESLRAEPRAPGRPGPGRGRRPPGAAPLPGSPRAATRPRRASRAAASASSAATAPARFSIAPARPGMSPRSWRMARLWRKSSRAVDGVAVGEGQVGEVGQHAGDAPPVAHLLQDRQRLAHGASGPPRDRRPGWPRCRRCPGRMPRSTRSPRPRIVARTSSVERLGRVEVALAGGHVGQVDRAEDHAAAVAQLAGQGDGLLVQRAGPGVVAQLEGGVGQVVGGVGDALAVADLAVEGQARLVEGGRRPGSRPA